MELRITEEDSMTRKWVAFVSVLLLSGTVAVAADVSSSFGTVDTDGNGSINRSELTANEGKLDPTMNPTLTIMDKDGSNSVDQDVVRGGKAEVGHRQGLQGVRQILVSVPEQS